MFSLSVLRICWASFLVFMASRISLVMQGAGGRRNSLVTIGAQESKQLVMTDVNVFTYSFKLSVLSI